MTFQRRPYSVEAIQWDSTEQTHAAVVALVGPIAVVRANHITLDALVLYPPSGIIAAQLGDWVIREQSGEVTTLPPEAFLATFEAV